MRRPNFSLKRLFFLVLTFAFAVLFVSNFVEYKEWVGRKNSVTPKSRVGVAAADAEDGELGNELVTPAHAALGAEETTVVAPNAQSNVNGAHVRVVEPPLSEQTTTAYGMDASYRRAWYFAGGTEYPVPTKNYHNRKERKRHALDFFPYENPHSDRIINQLMFVPHNYAQIKKRGKLKSILLFNGPSAWNVKLGRDVFQRNKCPVSTCRLTSNRDEATDADMILYKDLYIPSNMPRNNPKQVTMVYYLECPMHTQGVKIPGSINWTATYRRDSDIVAPYEKWQYYDTRVRQVEQDRNYAANKTGKVAWFVSNCGARNERLHYAHQLQKYITVDIYGSCGTMKCPRATQHKCFEKLDKEYKFYLAFENSNCKDYITEKFFVNALNHSVLPIVMGARPEDYKESAPQRSYIHVDEFATPKELADYLHLLDKDDERYNSYFKWKGTGEFINTYYWCRVCAALHNEEGYRKPRWYSSINDWWRGRGVCTTGSWRNASTRHDPLYFN